MILAAIVTSTLISSGMHLERDLAPGDEHAYTAQLEKGGGIVGEADQNGVDLVIDIFAPDGTKLKTVDSPNGRFGPEPIDVTALQAGTYKLVIHTLEKDAQPGKYVMKIDALLAADANADRLAKARYPSAALYELWRSARSDRKAVDNFFASRKGKGPIVDDVDATNVRVTYLYLGDEHTAAVRENGGPHAAAGGQLMTRFLDTPLFYASELVPRDARYTYGFAAIETTKVGDAEVSDDVFTNIDPLNPNAFAGFSLIALPDAPPQTYATENPSVPKGGLTKVPMGDRTISVYTPPNMAAGNELLIVFDAPQYTSYIPTPTILDNLIAEKKIRPTVTILVPNVNRNRDLGMHPEMGDFIASQLVPWARKTYSIAAGPQHVTIGGSSRGGFAAAYCALRHPETIGNVLSQSGSFWIVKDYDGPPRYPFSERSGDLIEAYRSSPKLPIRFYIEIGRFDNGTAMLPMNRELRDILMSKGYDVTYNEFDSGHDYVWWRGSFANGLIALLGR